MTKVAVIGAGWRAQFFLRLVTLLPDMELVGLVVRDPAKANVLGNEFHVQTFASVKELLQSQKVDFAISAVSWKESPVVIKTLVDSGVPVLSETPPAENLEELTRLWEQVGDSGLVQIAEQYPLMPMHAARLQAVKEGAIGTPTSVQVSSTHGYHAVALMRAFLGRPMGEASIQAKTFEAPLMNPLARDAWTGEAEPSTAKTVIATIDFGDQKSGVYDFTDNQWHNQLRHRRLVVRGSHGEISDENLVRLQNAQLITTSKFNRFQLGQDLNLDGHDTEHISLNGQLVWRNPFLGMRLMDEEIAIAGMITGMQSWVRNEGEEPYPLSQASQDFMIALGIDEAIETGLTVTTNTQLWA